jgi:glycosyltransferase involved in cell wall biosynthesis
MRIVVISDWFAEKMGYAENCLPKALARLGHEVYVVTSNLQVYFNSPTYKEVYGQFLGPSLTSVGHKEIDGYNLYRLPAGKWRGKLRIKNLARNLLKIHPQIVQTFDTFSLTTHEAAFYKTFCGYKLFLESHLHASVFPPAIQWPGIKRRFRWLLYAATIGRLVSFFTEQCYPISSDAADIAIQFFGIQPDKVKIYSLGVDTDIFNPANDEISKQARLQLRSKLGFSPSNIVCIFTGRFTNDKNPLCLAQAIGKLVKQGEPFRGLFVGSGPQAEAIQSLPGCVIHPFVSFRELPGFYRSADIGVWPKQESTSQLDAAACGLPIIIGNHAKVIERIDGNGLMYEEDNPEDLARKLCSLFDPQIRASLGECGAAKIQDRFSWIHIAKQRVRDYEAALQH